MMKYEFDTKRVDEILSRVYREPIENRNESGIIEERNDVETKVKCVWGSPLSGKSTYVEQHAGKNDIVWDWDKVKQAVGLVKPHEESRRILSDLLLKLRYMFLKSIDGSGAETAWFICTRPNEYIKNLLGEKAEYIKMDVSKEECLKRLENDNSRSDKQKMAELINDFFDEKRYNDGSHYTKDEHGQFTGSTGSGGGSSGGGSFGGLRKEPKLYSNGGSSGGRSSATETKEQKILREKIKNGELTKNIYKPKQELHYRGTQQYEDFTKKHSVEKSYFTVSMTELQGILNKKYATGRVHIDRAGKITEIFDCGKEIGYDTGMKRNTSFVKVHYSKSKTHLVPHTINPNAEKKE